MGQVERDIGVVREVKRPGPEFVTVAELAVALGVSRQAIEKAIRSGRLRAYSADGKPLPPDCGRKRKPVSRACGAARTGEVHAPASGVPDED